MKNETIDIVRIFNQAWAELYCPPVKITIGKEKRSVRKAKFSVFNGNVYLSPDVIPPGCDPEEYLLWHFRHELSHVHHCPYDIKTAYSLEKAAYEVTNNWALAYLATQIFCDSHVDINYLPRRFNELPYYMRVVGDLPRSLAEQIMKEIYLFINPIYKSRNKEVAETAREILTVTLLDKTWHTKVRIIAHIIYSLSARHPKMFSKKKLEKYIESKPLLVREDFLHSSLDLFTETYASISKESAAREFYNQWVKPRLSKGEKERIKSMIDERMREQKGRRKREIGKGVGKLDENWEDGKFDFKERSLSDQFTRGRTIGKEPHLPTSLSKPYTKIGSDLLEEFLWRRYWYKSRAEHVMIKYLAESRRHQPTWSVIKYPDEWYIEDEIEDLDVETSLDEGPLIPEVTTIKWVEEPTPHGQSMISGFVPSAITILDVSQSMLNVHNQAAVAAFIAYLSARKAGGQTSNVVFSTRYFSADWDSPEEVKELALAMEFNELTIFPAYEVLRLTRGDRGPCFLMIITDGGWQNIDEVIPVLERIAESGHKIVILLIKGGDYPEKIEVLKRTPNVRIYEVTEPETDLQGLTISESMRTYKSYLT